MGPAPARGEQLTASVPRLPVQQHDVISVSEEASLTHTQETQTPRSQEVS